MLSQYIPLDWLEALLIGSSILMAAIGFVALYYDTKIPRDWKRRMDVLKGIADNPIPEQSRRRRQSWQYILSLVGKWVKPRRESELSRTQHLLIQAGYRSQDDINIYYGLKFGLMIYLPAINYLVMSSNMSQLSPQFRLLIYASLIFFALVGSFLPEVVLKMQVKTRQEKIWHGFPDALDLLVLCVESGLSIDASLHRVADDICLTHPVLGEELRFVSDSIRSGNTRAAALKQLNLRTDIEDVHNFSSLVIQTEKLGVSITQGMRKIAESIRTKRRNQAEKLANELPVKMLFPLMIFFFPAIIVVLLLPALLSIWQAF